MPPTKDQLRKNIATKRKALNFHWQETASAQVVKNLEAQECFLSSETVALYKAIGGEVSLEALFSVCWSLGKRTCIPVFNSVLKIYEMAEITKKTDFIVGNYGIKEPLSPSLVPMSEIDLIAVPGVAFDRSGNRLGRGGGYYDRLLDGFTGLAVGIAFDIQLVEHIPTEPHDKPMDALITESIFVKVCNER